MILNRGLKQLEVAGQIFKIRHWPAHLFPKGFEPSFYHKKHKTIVLSNDTLTDTEWLNAMVHEITEIVVHEFFDPLIAQITTEVWNDQENPDSKPSEATPKKINC